MSSIPLSVLDLSPVTSGSDVATALRRSVELAQHSEALGYRRFWLAEHHFAAVASSSTVTLIGLVAAATSSIRVGSAAVQLGHHTPASVVEAFGTIDALHPGRLDLGLGRSGQKRKEATSASAPVRRSAPAEPAAEHEVDGLLIPKPFSLAGCSRHRSWRPPPPRCRWPAPRCRTSPRRSTTSSRCWTEPTSPTGSRCRLCRGRTPMSRCGSSEAARDRVRRSRATAVFRSSRTTHVSPATTLEAVEAYREAFVPSRDLTEPYVVVSADVVAADTDSAAVELASTFGHWVCGIRSGEGAPPYPDPANTPALTDAERAVVDDRIRTQFVGAPSTVADRLDTLARVTGADELVITSVTHDFAARKRSHELLAREWGLVAAQPV